MSHVAVQFYTRTKDAWEAMLADIRGATKTIDIEQYIFTVDSVGSEFLEELRKKAREGVKIRLLCDAVGSYSFYRSLIPDLLKTVNIEVKFFNPISPWRIANFTSNFFRDHRKIMVVDNTIGHIGGVGIQEHMAEWRDTHMRVTGPIVEDLSKSFATVWDGIKKWRFINFPKQTHFIRKFNLETNSPGFGQRHIYHNLISSIRNAKKYVYLTSPYFIPDVILFRVMRLAAKRGVDVRLLVPEVADHIFVNHAREAYFTLALKAGIKIYRYKGEMMHAKTAVIDDEWATAGSFNLDSLSFNFNHEANISTTEREFIQHVKFQFLEDLRSSEEVHLNVWIKRSLRKKLLEILTWPLHGIF